MKSHKKLNVLLIEPDYKNKYPPMGLMKISTYFRNRGDNVRFFKGNLKSFAAELICDDLMNYLNIVSKEVNWKDFYPKLYQYIQLGKNSLIPDADIFKNNDVLEALKIYRKKYQDKEYFENPPFDIVAITTLFTFYWKITIDTINFAKRLCKNPKKVMVGGIMASLLPDEVFKATDIQPHVGLLTDSKIFNPRAKSVNIDELPLDYSILEEIDYTYPANNAYFSYMTRGCINKCKFCAVPKLEPIYKNYIGLKKQLHETQKRFGEQKDLLLLDNNVLASPCFDKIIDEIKECGFEKGATYERPNLYNIAIKNLKESFNDRAYIRRITTIYNELYERLQSEDEKKDFMNKIENVKCFHYYTAKKEEILKLDEYIRPIYEKYHKPSRIMRHVDFNQGVDSRLITEENMKKLAEVNIRPLRIAFDHWSLRETYEKAVRIAATNGISNLSNYLLYNFEDKPEDLYNRLRLNVELCDELGISIYSFPMKYHPITDPQFYMNRDYIGKHWNRKFIRSIQAVLNSTKGKIGKGLSFFEEAFGKDIDEFHKILWMPETFIIYRRRFNQELRTRLEDKYQTVTENDSDLVHEWWDKFSNLPEKKKCLAEDIIKNNKFGVGDYSCNDQQISDVLSYYKIHR